MQRLKKQHNNDFLLSSHDLERFWNKVVKPSEEDCWRWKTNSTRQAFKINGDNVPPRRVMYKIFYGCVPDVEILVICGNQRCVNPKHLRPQPQLEDRFWSKVNKNSSPTGCWMWEGAIVKYGVIDIGGNQRLAHRVSWELTYGEIPEGEGYHGTCVCHRCDNPLCVNPEHLFLGSIADNMKDRNNKNRQAKGERSGPSKLKEIQVKEIRRLYKLGGETCRTLANKFGVSNSLVKQIVRGTAWSYLNGKN